MLYQIRKRTKPEDIVYSLHLYFSGLSLRNTSKALSRFIHRSHSAIRDWIQRYKPERLFFIRKIKINEFVVDETQIKVGSELIWLWVAIDLKQRTLLKQAYQKRETCLWQRDFYTVLQKNMVNMSSQQTVAHGIHKLVNF